MKNNLINDLSTITTIHESTLISLLSKINLIISHSIQEAKLAGEDVAEIDIFIGTLLVKISDDELRYKFIPSSKLETTIKDSLNNSSQLVLEIESALKDKVLNVYKDLF